MSARLVKSESAQTAAARLLGFYLKFALGTTRWRLEGEEHLRPFLPGGAVILACWHERLAMMPALWLLVRRRYPDRHVVALASRHRDGRLLAGVLGQFGIRLVHGSTQPVADSGRRRPRGGAAALRALLSVLREGAAIVITPDGPRGPRRVAAPGVAQLGAVSGAPVLPVAAQTGWHIRLKTWDRMVVPLPFGRGVLVVEPPVAVAPDRAADALALIEAALTRAADRADRR
jgi:lysophospholipid acyltransferase (LPLAT)-like uncharacterized protein